VRKKGGPFYCRRARIGRLCAIPAGLYLDLCLAGVAGGRWTLVHVMLFFTGGLGALWLWDEMADQRMAKPLSHLSYKRAVS
jgi:hypothetical protein